jgi:hypothetical protein
LDPTSVITTVLVILLLFICLFLPASIEAKGIRWPRGYDRLDHTALREGSKLGAARFDLRPESLGVSFALVRNVYAWQDVQGFDKGPEAFNLTLTESNGIFVPKRAIAHEAARESFKDFATSPIAGRQRRPVNSRSRSPSRAAAWRAPRTRAYPGNWSALCANTPSCFPFTRQSCSSSCLPVLG